MSDVAKIVRMKRVKGCGHDEGAGHDCAWVDFRNGLVAEAEMRADAVAGPAPAARTVGALGFDANGRGTAPAEAPEEDRWSKRWNGEFHREMTRLAADPVRRAAAGLDAFGGSEVEYPEAPEQEETVH